MRFLNIYAASFGKLKDFTLEPQEGLNRYTHPNEYGKTTLIYFIFFMLYGYDARRLKSYFPWSGEPMAGALTLEQGGKRWRIERLHPQKGAEKRKIFSPDTGEELTLPAKEQPGPYFLKIDGETFLRTFCITQGDLLFSRTDGLDLALKNMAATGDENVSFSQAEAWLHKQHTRYMYRGKTQGPLLDLQKELEQDRLRLSEVRRLVEDRLHAKEEWDRLEKEQALKAQELTVLKDLLGQAIRSDALKKWTQLKKLREQAPMEPPAVSQEDLGALELAFSEAERAQKAEADAALESRQCQTQWELLGASMEQFGFHAMTAQQIEKLQRTGKGGTIAAAVLGLLGLLAAAGSFSLSSWLLILGAGLMAAALILFFAEKGKKDHILRTNGAVSTAQLLEKWTQYQDLLHQREQQDLLRKEAAERLETLHQKSVDAQTALEQLKTRHRILNLEELQNARIQWGVYEQSLARKSDLQEQLLLGGKTEEELRQLAEGAPLLQETAEQAQQRLGAAQEQVHRLQQQKEALNTADLATLWAEQATLREGIAEKEARVALWERELIAVQQSLSWLKAANEEMNTHFAPKLCTLAGEHLHRLTEGKYETLTLDEQYTIQLSTKEGTYPLSQFSQGTRDAVYFAFRLAVGTLLSETPLPMVLDDPFVNLDEERFTAAQDLLKKAAEGRQILYFTCR